MAEVTLGPSGERSLREAENLCAQANVGIIAAEHLLAGALLAAIAEGAVGLPEEDAVVIAALMVHGAGSEPLSQNVMYGSSARAALNSVAGTARETGETTIDAAGMARGIVESGEVSPMFYSSLGVGRGELVRALGG